MRRLLSVGLFTLTVACGGADTAPCARIDLSPPLVCEGAPAATVIVSGTHSTDANGETDGLRFAWSLSREPEEIVRGALDEPELVVRISTAGPTGVTLRLWDRVGAEGERQAELGVTRTQARLCAQGCGSREICAPTGGVEICTNDFDCSEDSECGCWVCRADDLGARRCLPAISSP